MQALKALIQEHEVNKLLKSWCLYFCEKGEGLKKMVRLVYKKEISTLKESK